MAGVHQDLWGGMQETQTEGRARANDGRDQLILVFSLIILPAEFYMASNGAKEEEDVRQ